MEHVWEIWLSAAFISTSNCESSCTIDISGVLVKKNEGQTAAEDKIAYQVIASSFTRHCKMRMRWQRRKFNMSRL
jgi:hypothetical protein